MKERIYQLWNDKLGRNVDSYNQGWVSLWKEIERTIQLEWDGDKIIHFDEIKNILDEEERLALLSLVACQFRQSGKINLANLQMNHLKQHVDQMEKSQAFFFFYAELSSQTFMEGSVISSFQCAHVALEVAFCDLYKAVALSALLLSEEALGIFPRKTLDHLDKILLRNKGDLTFLGTKQVFDSFKFRFDFRMGKIDEYLIKEISKQGIADHRFYSVNWVLQCPYVLFNFDKKVAIKNVLNLLVQYPQAYYRIYLTETILGIWNESHLEMLSANDKIERLYLWLWKWMTEENDDFLDNVIQQLKCIDYINDIQKMSMTGILMYRICLSWLILFDLVHEKELRSILLKIQNPVIEFTPLLNFELMLVDYLIHKRQGREKMSEDILSKIETCLLNFPLSKQIILSDLILKENISESHPLYHLHSRLNLSKAKDFNKNKIIVILDQNKIIALETNLFSRQKARALSLFHHHNSISVSDFFCFSFEVNHYDEETHRRKLFKLLKEIREIGFPLFNLKLKENRVLFIGHSDVIELYYSGILKQSLSQNENWLKIISQFKRSSFSLSAPKSQGKHELMITRYLIENKRAFSQKELSHHLQIKRTTLLRGLSILQKEDQVKRLGIGRSVVYVSSTVV